MPEAWFLEKHTRHVGITIEVRERLFEEQSEFQKVEVLDTPEFGRILLLDGAIMFTERDEPAYHEMLVHPPLFAHPRPERVLVVGGGDGGTIRELLKHEAVRSITLVEIDRMVIDVCRRFFPALSAGIDDPKVSVEIADGFAFLDAHLGEFDTILVDSTDPVPLAAENEPGPAEPLFTAEFYGKLHAALRPGGLTVFQSENPFYSGAILAKMHRELRGVFGKVQIYFSNIPTYPGGYWSFTSASDTVDLRRLRVEQPPRFLADLNYFQPAMFPGALVAPRYVERLLAE